MTEPSPELADVLKCGHAAASVYLLLVAVGAAGPGGWRGSVRQLQALYRELTRDDDRPKGRSIQWPTLSTALGLLVAAEVLIITPCARGATYTLRTIKAPPVDKPVESVGKTSNECSGNCSTALETAAPRESQTKVPKSAAKRLECSGNCSTEPLPAPYGGWGREGVLGPAGLSTGQTGRFGLRPVPAAARRAAPMSTGEETARRSQLKRQLGLALDDGGEA